MSYPHVCWIVASDQAAADEMFRNYREATDSQALVMIEEEAILTSREAAERKRESLRFKTIGWKVFTMDSREME